MRSLVKKSWSLRASDAVLHQVLAFMRLKYIITSGFQYYYLSFETVYFSTPNQNYFNVKHEWNIYICKIKTYKNFWQGRKTPEFSHKVWKKKNLKTPNLQSHIGVAVLLF